MLKISNYPLGQAQKNLSLQRLPPPSPKKTPVFLKNIRVTVWSAAHCRHFPPRNLPVISFTESGIPFGSFSFRPVLSEPNCLKKIFFCFVFRLLTNLWIPSARLKAFNFAATRVRELACRSSEAFYGAAPGLGSTRPVPHPRQHSWVRNLASLAAAGLVRVPRLGQSDTTFFSFVLTCDRSHCIKATFTPATAQNRCP